MLSFSKCRQATKTAACSDDKERHPKWNPQSTKGKAKIYFLSFFQGVLKKSWFLCQVFLNICPPALYSFCKTWKPPSTKCQYNIISYPRQAIHTGHSCLFLIIKKMSTHLVNCFMTSSVAIFCLPDILNDTLSILGVAPFSF